MSKILKLGDWFGFLMVSLVFVSRDFERDWYLMSCIPGHNR